MPSDSYKSYPNDLNLLVTGNESREKYMVKAKLGLFKDQISNPWLNKEVSSGSVPRSDDISDSDHSSLIVVENYPLEKKYFRRPMICSVRKSKSSTLSTESSGVNTSRSMFSSLGGCYTPRLRVPPIGQDHLHPPKGEVVVLYWTLEFGLKLPIQSFYRRLLANLQMGPNF
ncbi:hypothetical protein ACOSQ2_005300 [Xanthoceras sorbifolium]